MIPLAFALLQDLQPLPADPNPPPPPQPVQEQPPPPVEDPVLDEPRRKPQPPPPEIQPEPEPEMSEGRMLVSAYNSGFQWGISPGIVVVNGDVGFALGARIGYGFDLGAVILVPGLKVEGFFTDPSVYLGMPTVKLVVPIDRFAPFLEGGTGVGWVSDPSKTGVALMGGGGFMVHFRHFAFGAEVSYTAITGTKFHGIGFGPILAFGF